MTHWRHFVHLARWELTRARMWILALAAAIVAAAIATALRRWDGGTSMLPIVVSLVTLFGVASVMTESPPLDPTAFGVGKPVDRVALIAAKFCLTIGLCLIVVLLVQAVVQTSLGMTWSSVRNDAIASGALLQSMLFSVMAVSVVARSLRQVVVGAVLIIGLLSIGTQLLIWGARDAAFGLHVIAGPTAMQRFAHLGLYLPLVFVGRMLYKPLSTTLARVTVALLVMLQLISTVMATIAMQSIDAMPADRSHLMVDSVGVSAARDQYRVAVRLAGVDDSITTVLDYSQILSVVTHDDLADTLDFVGREDTDEAVSRKIGDRAFRSGVLLFKSRSANLPSGILTFRLKATQYHREQLSAVPTALGTLIDRDGVRLELRVDSLQRLAMRVTTVGGGFFSGAIAGDSFSRFDLRTENAAGDCCESLELIRISNNDMAFVLLPGAARTKAESLVDGDITSFAASHPRLRIAEWKRDTTVVFEVVTRVPALSK